MSADPYVPVLSSSEAGVASKAMSCMSTKEHSVVRLNNFDMASDLSEGQATCCSQCVYSLPAPAARLVQARTRGFALAAMLAIIGYAAGEG